MSLPNRVYPAPRFAVQYRDWRHEDNAIDFELVACEHQDLRTPSEAFSGDYTGAHIDEISVTVWRTSQIIIEIKRFANREPVSLTITPREFEALKALFASVDALQDIFPTTTEQALARDRQEFEDDSRDARAARKQHEFHMRIVERQAKDTGPIGPPAKGTNKPQPGSPPYRLIGVDMFAHEEYGPYGESYETIEEARQARDAANARSLKEQPGGMSDRHYIRDADGKGQVVS